MYTSVLVSTSVSCLTCLASPICFYLECFGKAMTCQPNPAPSCLPAPSVNVRRKQHINMQCQMQNWAKWLGNTILPCSEQAHCAPLPDIADVFHQLPVPLSTSLTCKQGPLFSFHFSFSTKLDVLFPISPLISRIDGENKLRCNFSSGFRNFKVCHLDLETETYSLPHSLSQLTHTRVLAAESILLM